MKLYFDTNVHRFITEANDASRVGVLLRQFDCRLIVSAGNLFETYAIRSPKERARETGTIVQLGHNYQSDPESYLHAVELRHEIRRLRPKWLDPTPHTREIRGFLESHRERWIEARTGQLPPAEAYEVFSRVSEQGIESARRFQMNLRASLTEACSRFYIQTPSGDMVPVDPQDPEVSWRVQGLLAWHQAIEAKSPASRDYADWLGPYLRPHAFGDDGSYSKFWLNDVEGKRMPLNQLTGLVAHFQLKQRATHGNPADQIHATCWFLNDLFLTADRAFHEALSAAARHYPNHTPPVLVSRGAASFASQLEQILRSRSVS